MNKSSANCAAATFLCCLCAVTSEAARLLQAMKVLLVLLYASTGAGWVLFSPVRRTLQKKAYEDNFNRPWEFERNLGN